MLRWAKVMGGQAEGGSGAVRLGEMMAERGLSMAHTTIMRRVQRYAPEFEKRWPRLAQAVRRWGGSTRPASRPGASGAICIVRLIGRSGRSISG